jgi:hypothetical protein
MMDKMQAFCSHIRAALACYVDLPPEGQARARFYTRRKLEALKLIQSAGDEHELATGLLHRLQQLDGGNNEG